MYKQNKPDTEDFLLGKRIDKFGEEEEKKEEGLYTYVDSYTCVQ